MKKNILLIIVALMAVMMCTEASAQRETKIATAITGRHTVLMSVEANAMADTDPITGSFKADMGGLAKLTYFYYGNSYSFKLGYRRENVQVALSYARNLTSNPDAKLRPNLEIEVGTMNQTRSLYYQADENTPEGKPAATHDYYNYKPRLYAGLSLNCEIAAGTSAVEVGVFGYYLPHEGKAAPGDIKTTVGGSDVSGQMVSKDLHTSKFKVGVKVAYKFDVIQLVKKLKKKK